MKDLKDFKDFEDFEFEEEKKGNKFPKITITKKQIFTVIVIAIVLYIGYIYLQYLTPKHLEIVCKTENGYNIPCPSYIIKDKNGKVISKNDLLPGKYNLIIQGNDYHSGTNKEIEINTEQEQTKELKLSGIDIEHIDTNISVYPKVKGNIKIIFYNPYLRSIPYSIELKGDNGYYKKFEGSVTKKEQEVIIGDIFCLSTQKNCLGRKKYLEYKLKIKYGDITTEKKIYVYVLPDIKIKLEGPKYITLHKNETLEEMYKITLDSRMPEPLYNISVDVINLDPFILNISKTKFNLYPGNPEEFNVIYKYSFGTQDKYKGMIKIKKDLYEYTTDIYVYLKNRR